jgi:Nucleoside-diphosphate-sugar epimerases
MKYLNSETYRENVKTAVGHIIGFNVFFNKSVLILGASGLIGSFITDCFIYANENIGARITIYAVSRNIAQLKERFGDMHTSCLNFIESDVTVLNSTRSFDYIIHAASYGHPRAFREMPVEVLLSNVMGTQKALEIAKLNTDCRMLYVSSGEAQEEVDHLSVRACYPMGKKAAETLCISHYKEYDTSVIIARPCHTFGANVMESDNRATAQFIASAVKGRNIAMYSAGEQVRTFSYVADTASGLLTALAAGQSGAVYGVSPGESCSVREFADKCASAGKCRVEMHLPSGTEKAETSPIADQIVGNDALKKLGWQPAFSIDRGIEETFRIMKEMERV